MTAGEIVEKLKDYSSINLQPVCSLHKECRPKPRCGAYQYSLALNFDKVKETYCKNKGISSKASADGVTERSGKLVFIEIKGWDEFLNRLPRYNTSKIEKQAKKYTDIKKCIDSIDICKDITAINDFSKIEFYYILVTDIDTKVNPLDRIMWNLDRLAGDSTKIQTVCNLLIEENLNNNFEGLDVKYKYYHCRQLDYELMNLI